MHLICHVTHEVAGCRPREMQGCSIHIFITQFPPSFRRTDTLFCCVAQTAHDIELACLGPKVEAQGAEPPIADAAVEGRGLLLHGL